MSRKGVQRLCGNDMHENSKLKPVALISFHAGGFSRKRTACHALPCELNYNSGSDRISWQGQPEESTMSRKTFDDVSF
jgi:hypothetical protein